MRAILPDKILGKYSSIITRLMLITAGALTVAVLFVGGLADQERDWLTAQVLRP